MDIYILPQPKQQNKTKQLGWCGIIIGKKTTTPPPHCCNFVAVYLKAGLIYALNHNMKLCGTTGVAPHMGEDTGAGGLGTGAGIKL